MEIQCDATERQKHNVLCLPNQHTKQKKRRNNLNLNLNCQQLTEK